MPIHATTRTRTTTAVDAYGSGDRVGDASSHRTYGHTDGDHFEGRRRKRGHHKNGRHKDGPRHDNRTVPGGLRPHQVMRLDRETVAAPTAAVAGTPVSYAELEKLADTELLAALRLLASGRRRLEYAEARRLMFGRIDNQGGKVREVYTGRVIHTRDIPPADGPDGVNTEHTFPKSRGVGGTAAESDLHHLFPTDSEANSQRRSYSFGEVVEITWQEQDSKLGYDDRGRVVFEPPDVHKGNVARALFYISATYGLRIPDGEEEVLKRWSLADPVDDAERARNDAIAAVQNNRNPFIDAPALADQISDF